jgi:hypothetical protein
MLIGLFDIGLFMFNLGLFDVQFSVIGFSAHP